MPTAETAFWGDDVLITEALTPIAVMRQAAAQLPIRTKNLLEAEIETVTTDFEGMEHTFSIVAPGLDRYACPVFMVRHNTTLVYPAITKSLVHDEVYAGFLTRNTEDELRSEVRRILNMGSVKSIIYALLAKLNEAKVRQSSQS